MQVQKLQFLDGPGTAEAARNRLFVNLHARRSRWQQEEAMA